jgi:hypothetical protein
MGVAFPMNSIKSEGLEPKKEKTSKNIFKVSLSLALMVFVFNISPVPSLFQPAMAAGLSGVRVVPMSNLATMQTTYDIFFTTATTGTINTVEMNFGSPFNIASATKYIERSGIGSGTLSVSGSILKYTVNNPVSISAGTNIRLEIARIIANNVGSFTVSITTRNTGNSIIDGPTQSSSFSIFAVGSNAVSSDFMLRKTLLDDAAGHAHGWNPTGGANPLFVSDSDISGSPGNIFVSVMVPALICATSVIDTNAHIFIVLCNNPPPDNSKLDYVIIKLPAHVVTSSLSVSSSESSSQYESLRAHDQIASEFP